MVDIRKRLAFLLLTVLVLLLVPVVGSSAHPLDLHGSTRVERPAAARKERPNVVVVMVDDMRSDEMKFAPNTRKYIRDRGLDFRNSFSPFPLCCPARASFLLGTYAHNHRVLYHEAPYGFGSLNDRVTIATRMQGAGYQTAMVGKYLNKYGWQKSKVTGRASEHYVPAGWTDWMAGLETPWRRGSGKSGNTYDYFNYTQNINGRTVQNRGAYSSTLIGNQVQRLISTYHRSSKPFFLWVTPVAPHHGGPYESDDPRNVRRANGRLQKIVTPARPNWVKGLFDKWITRAPGQPAKGPAEANVRDKPRNVRNVPETTPREKRALRDAARQRAEAIYAWDKEFGKIVSRLKATGEFENTVLMFTSDNGFYLGEHRQRMGKIKAYEPVIHVPLAIAGPGIGRGARYTPTTTFDLTATILDIVGAKKLPAMDGSSKAPQIWGPDNGWDTPVVTEGLLTGVRRVDAGHGVPRGFTTSGLRTGRYKLIRYSTGEAELYDLLTDPNELRSVWKDPAYEVVRTEMVRLWYRYKSCKQATCRELLPAHLRTTPSWLDGQYRHAVEAKASYYNR